MFVYTKDVLKLLKDKGYSTYRIRQENLINQTALRDLKSGKMVGIITLDKICSLLEVQPYYFMEWQPDPQPETEPEQ